MLTLQHYLTISVVLFSLGVIGLAARRSFLVSMMCIQLMFSSACLAILAFSRWNLLPGGKAQCLIMMSAFICVFVVGLAIYHVMYRKTGSVDSDSMNSIKG